MQKQHALVLLLLTTGPPVQAKRGEVIYVTTDHIYLGDGTADGVRMGDVLLIERSNKKPLTCQVNHVAGHYSRCIGKNIRIGAKFQIQTPPDKEAATVGVRPDLPGYQALEQAHQQLAAVTFQPVVDKSSRLTRKSRITIALRHQSSGFIGARASQSHVERVDLRGQGLPVYFLPLNLYVDLSAFRWSERPQNSRFRPGRPTQLYVWEGALVRRNPNENIAFASGRVRPYGVPGVPFIDGLQLGWRAENDRTEIGLYGGGVPDAITLATSTTQWSAGGYYRKSHNYKNVMLQHSGRFAYVRTKSGASRYELEPLLYLWLFRSLRISINPRVAIDKSEQTSPVVLDALRASIDMSAKDFINVFARLRWTRTSLALAYGLEDNVTPSKSSWRSDTGLAWTISPYLVLRGIVGIVQDRTENLRRVVVGPELSLPQGLGRLGGIDFGYEQATGWWSGTTLYAQFLMRLSALWQATYRMSYLQDNVQNNALREFHGTLSTQLHITPTLAARFYALTTVGRLNPNVAVLERPVGVSLMVSLFGNL